MRDPLICDWLNGNNKRRAGLFGNAGKDLFGLLLSYQPVIPKFSEDRCCYPQVYVGCHIEPPYIKYEHQILTGARKRINIF